MVDAVEGLRIMSFGVQRSSGVLTSSSIVQKIAVTRANLCVLGRMDLASVIHGCFVGIVRLVDPNLVR